MRLRLWPASLYGRVALLVFSALVLAHGLTFLALLRERSQLSQTMMLAYLGRDVASAVAMLERLPAAERPPWLALLERPNYRYALLDGPPAQAYRLEGREQALAAGLSEQLRAADRPSSFALRLQDGQWLSLQLALPPLAVSDSAKRLLALQLGLLALATWWGVSLAVRPLRELAEAVDGMGRRQPVKPLTESGPLEVAQAARAFNTLQTRIAAHVTERLHLLASISHDLQTPITRLKLRLEATDLEPAQRERLLADLDGMQALVEQGLAYARTRQAQLETPRPVDLEALLDGMVCDAVDAGQAASWTGACPAPLLTRPQALRRVLGNLIDNALKFGGRAELELEQTAGQVLIRLRDGGPGIPEQELAKVMQAFYRVEGSRNLESGGSGLGLAIAKALVDEALGGQLSLHNLAGGGLEVGLSLPLRPPQACFAET
ncbi:signal transduction histidine kinase [Paucibacter oligotrophus]|uniref:histidine kinase n=1 Tax=Roseateles oligotrophus TaxID=1769250 RepID=A0A840L9Z8_9BURK|nr:ATP-binding protein [Roseateles oligotrophus]MBB4844946.1 signal transduction histidine kinase [Roseateles oligotrophus]